MYVYVYIYIEREREREIHAHIRIHTQTRERVNAGVCEMNIPYFNCANVQRNCKVTMFNSGFCKFIACEMFSVNLNKGF